VFVKICGITTEEDALLAVAMGADAVGFIFAPSPRQVSPAAVDAIVRRLPPEVLTVGVFRDDLPERVVEIVGQAGLRAAQLHGHERPEEVAQVAATVRFVIKGFAASSRLIEEAGSYRTNAILIDSPAPGSGQVFDWRLAEGLPRSRRVILAGGLTGDNVATAIARVHPWGVDASSGLESSPGHKDPRKVRAFIQAARAAEPDRYESQLDAPYDWQEEA
jgi:phosphoribosylanthranilate isomerase